MRLFTYHLISRFRSILLLFLLTKNNNRVVLKMLMYRLQTNLQEMRQLLKALVPPSLPFFWPWVSIPSLTLTVAFVRSCGEPKQYYWFDQEERIYFPKGPWWGLLQHRSKRASNDWPWTNAYSCLGAVGYCRVLGDDCHLTRHVSCPRASTLLMVDDFSSRDNLLDQKSKLWLPSCDSKLKRN